jgi:hypothetical protein
MCRELSLFEFHLLMLLTERLMALRYSLHASQHRNNVHDHAAQSLQHTISVARQYVCLIIMITFDERPQLLHHLTAVYYSVLQAEIHTSFCSEVAVWQTNNINKCFT